MRTSSFEKPASTLPFPEPLEDTEFRDTIKALKSHPDKLIRVRHLPEEYIPEAQRHQEGIKHFEVIRDRYGIALPKVDLIVGTEEGLHKMLIVADKIQGKNLDELKEFPMEAKGKLDAFFSALAQYYYDVDREGGLYWYDLQNHQFVYGHKVGVTENKVYLVDIDPKFREWDPQKKESRESPALEFLPQIYGYVLTAERKFSPPIKLIGAREKIRKLTEVLIRERPQNAVLKELMRRL